MGAGVVCFPPEGCEIVIILCHTRREVLWMDFVLMIIFVVVIALAIIIYPKKDTFIDKFKFKGTLKSVELEISTKQKSSPHSNSDRSNLK